MQRKPKALIKIVTLLLSLLFLLTPVCTAAANTSERKIFVNQVGYYSDGEKLAVIEHGTANTKFYLVNAKTEEVVFGAKAVRRNMSVCADFSEYSVVGEYYIITSSGAVSPTFYISADPYKELTGELVKFFYYQRCGTALVGVGDQSHAACHNWNANVYNSSEQKVGTMDAIGGWHDAGDYGRYMLPQTAAVYQLMSAYEKNPDIFGDDSLIPESGNGIADILDECRWELEWMLKMQNTESGGFYPQVHSKDFIQTTMPENDKHELAVTPITTESTAKCCAVMASAARIYRGIDAKFADKCLTAAEKAWAFLEKHPYGLLTLVSFTQYTHKGNVRDVDYDDIYWAAADLFRTTGEKKYLDKFVQLQKSIGTQTEVGWGNAGAFGTITFLETENELIDPTLKTRIANDFARFAENGPLKLANSSPFFNGDTNWWWGSNMNIANSGYLMYAAGELSGNEEFYIPAFRQINYLLGMNTHDTCFVTDYGTTFPKTPLHGPSKASGERVPGALVGGAYEKEDYYVDDPENYYCNEVSCYYNSALIVTLAYASVCKDKDATATPTDQKPIDVSGMTSEDVWDTVNGVSNKNTEASAENAESTPDTTEPSKKCGSSITSVTAVLVSAIALPPLIPFKKKHR